MEDEVNVTSDAPPTRPDVDSIERALDQIGDRWTFLLLREAYFGIRRFDEFQQALGASPAVLSDRLRRMVDDGLFEKVQYGNHSRRFEYRLTEKGRELFPVIVLMVRWGDRWCDDGDGPPIVLHHHCDPERTTTDSMRLRCDACGETVVAEAVTWTPGPT